MSYVETTSMHVTLVDKYVPVNVTDIFFFYVRVIVCRHGRSKYDIRFFLAPTFFIAVELLDLSMTFVVVVAMDEHCCLEHRFMRVRNVEVLDLYLNLRHSDDQDCSITEL